MYAEIKCAGIKLPRIFIVLQYIFGKGIFSALDGHILGYLEYMEI